MLRALQRTAAILATALVGLAVATAPASATADRAATGSDALAGGYRGVSLDLNIGGVTCVESVISGQFATPPELPEGMPANVALFSATGCGIAGVPMNISAGSLPWVIESLGPGPRVPVSIRGVSLSGSNTDVGCFFDAAGPGTSTGTLTGFYDVDTSALVINGGDLVVRNAACLGLFNNGDPVPVSASYAITPTASVRR